MFIVGIISIAIFAIAILMISTNIYEFEKEKKIQFIIIGIIVMLVLTWIIVSISSIGIQVENKEYIRISKLSSVFIFAPINSIFALPYLGNIINKLKQERLTNGQVKTRVLILLIILIIIGIIEISYIKSFQIGMLSNAIK